ncbi:MAG TPA: MFS transporter [Chthonomonadaceae bacterium]|nr:MFS transporter [Chthonomonadaceae bacterium]
MERPTEAGTEATLPDSNGQDPSLAAQAIVAGEVEEAQGEASEPQQPLSPLQSFWYCVANLGYGAFYSFNNAVLPLFLQNYTQDARLIGLMGSTHSFEGAVIQPVVGSASDRLRTRLGRRRPFMLVFTPLSALFMLLTPAASHLPIGVRLTAIVGCIFLFTVFFNVAFDPYQALMPDITPEPQRGRVMGLWAFLGVLGQAALVMLPQPPAVKFGIVAVLMLITTGWTCAMIREPRHPAHSAADKSHWQEVFIALRGLRILRQARRSLIALFFSGIGIGAVLPFLTLFVEKIAGANDQQAQRMFLVLMLATAAGVIPCGWLTDRIGPKRMLLLGLALIALASLNGLWVTNLTQITLVMILAGLGNAAQSASAYPLLTELVPAEEIGFYTGLQTTALSVASPLTSVLTGELVNQGGYRLIFVVCAASILIALGVLALVSLQAARDEVGLRNRQQGRAP